MNPDPNAGETFTVTWRHSAACRGMDPALFYPDKGVGHRIAKRTCAACPVRRECLQDALETDETRHGLRGGLTPRQRQALARSRRHGIQTCSTVSFDPTAPFASLVIAVDDLTYNSVA